jgi:hypothetical protein
MVEAAAMKAATQTLDLKQSNTRAARRVTPQSGSELTASTPGTYPKSHIHGPP